MYFTNWFCLGPEQPHYLPSTLFFAFDLYEYTFLYFVRFERFKQPMLVSISQYVYIEVYEEQSQM